MSAQNKAKTGANAVGFVAAVIVALLFANIIMTRLFTRFDFTAERVYTLSPASKELVAKLPDKMTVKAFISSDLQPPLPQTAQYVRDLLDEYAAASKGKFKWEALDPSTDPRLEEEATKLKVPKLQQTTASSSKFQIGTHWLGVAFQYQGNIESIPAIAASEGLEFQISGLIRNMTQKKKKIAFATSEGELSTQGGGDQMHGGQGGGLQIVSQFMKFYDVVSVDLSKGDKPLADDVDGLIIPGPKQAMSERAKFVVDQFLMKGKSVAFFVDGMVIESTNRGMPQMPGMPDQPKIGRKNDHGMDDLLEHYGFRVRDDVIMEAEQTAPGPVTIQGQMFFVNHPAFVVATNLAEKTSVTEHVKALILPFASSMELLKDKQPGLQVTQLAASTANSWRQTGFFLFDPKMRPKVSEERGPFTFGYVATGKLKSFFAGKPYPNEKGEKVPPPSPDSSSAPDAARPLDESTGSPRIVIMADSDFVSDEYLRMVNQIRAYSGNLLFFMNVVDYLAADETFATIRAKGMTARPIAVEKESTVPLIKYGNIVGVPLAFILFGVMRWRMRTARRKAAKL